MEALGIPHGSVGGPLLQRFMRLHPIAWKGGKLCANTLGLAYHIPHSLRLVLARPGLELQSDPNFKQ